MLLLPSWSLFLCDNVQADQQCCVGPQQLVPKVSFGDRCLSVRGEAVGMRVSHLSHNWELSHLSVSGAVRSWLCEQAALLGAPDGVTKSLLWSEPPLP